MTFGDLITIGCLGIALWYVPRYLWRLYGPALMSSLSSSRADDGGSETSSALPRTSSSSLVLPHQNQECVEPVFDFSGVLAYLSEHNLSDEQMIDLLATARRMNSEHFVSANKIRDIVGGADAAVKARVAERRPRAAQTRTRPGHLERPANGW